jgi:hypothetical protein
MVLARKDFDLSQCPLWHKADVLVALSNVRFWGQSGHYKNAPRCPLLTQSGHRPLPVCRLKPLRCRVSQPREWR